MCVLAWVDSTFQPGSRANRHPRESSASNSSATSQIRIEDRKFYHDVVVFDEVGKWTVYKSSLAAPGFARENSSSLSPSPIVAWRGLSPLL